MEATKLVKVMQFGGDMSIFKNILHLPRRDRRPHEKAPDGPG
ncbi:MAG: hypothetical protein V8S34_05365 [Lawsonibacter sp.]